MTRQCIITFMGPVGVGKSNQIKLLQNYFLSNKNKVVTTFIKSSHLLAYLILKFLRLLHKDVDKNLLSLLYLLDVISISVKFLFKVYIPFHLGFIILIEEGPMMTLFTYAVRYPTLSHIKPKKHPFIPRLIGWILKQKHVNVILSAENNELVKRRKNRNYRRYERSEYVFLQKKWFNQINMGNTIFIETTNLSALQTNKLIVTAIREHATWKETRSSLP